MSSFPQRTPAPTVGPRRAAVAFIFVTVLIDILSFGIIIPVLPNLIKQLTGGSYAHAAGISGLLATLFMLIQFVCTPIQGALSDRFGRRSVLLISSFGLAADFMLMAMAPSLWVLLIGRIFSGMCAASFSTANAYLADVAPAEKRAAAYGLLGAAFGLGFVVGPALGGLIGSVHLRLPFWLAAGLSLLNVCYGFFVLPESLSKDQRSPRFEWKHASPFGSLLLLRRYRSVLGLATVYFLMALAQFSLNSTYVLYTEYRFGWGPDKVGYTLALVGLCTGLVQAVLVRRLMPTLGARSLILIGLGLNVVGYLMFGLANNHLFFVLSIPLLCLGGLSGPPAQALMTQQVSPTEQGRLQGALSSLSSLSGIFGPAMFASLFAWFISDHAPLPHLPGIAFLVAAGLLLIAMLLAWHYTRASHLGQQEIDASAPLLPPTAAANSLPAADVPLPHSSDTRP